MLGEDISILRWRQVFKYKYLIIHDTCGGRGELQVVIMATEMTSVSRDGETGKQLSVPSGEGVLRQRILWEKWLGARTGYKWMVA